MSRLTHLLASSSLSSSPLSSSIVTPSLCHSRLKTCLFNKSFPPLYFFFPWTAFMIMGPFRTYHAFWCIFSSFFFIFFCFSCGGLSWLYTSAFYCTLLHIIIVPYRSAPVDYSIFSRFHVQVGTEMEFLARTACWRPMSVIVAGVAAACHGTATGSARQGENKEPALPAMCCAQPWHGGDIKISRSDQLCC